DHHRHAGPHSGHDHRHLPAGRLQGVRPRQPRCRRARRHQPRRRPRGVRLPRRGVGLRQVHQPEPHRRPRPPHDRRGHRTGPHRPHVPGGGPLPVADGARQRRPAAAAGRHETGRAPPPGRGAAGPGAPGWPGRPPSARALRWHAPAGRAGPGPGPGRRDPPHGRAVRRPRRHDPRPAARRARAGVGQHRPHDRLRHPQRPRGGPAVRPDRPPDQPARQGGRRVPRHHRPAPPHRLTRGDGPGRGGHRPAAGRGPPPRRL
ncbi:MAG: ABC-type probable sulfate transporter, ATPase component, partial [uncultured Acidimicrobiales bacterium]